MFFVNANDENRQIWLKKTLSILFLSQRERQHLANDLSLSNVTDEVSSNGYLAESHSQNGII